jgi:hypothetical protein
MRLYNRLRLQRCPAYGVLETQARTSPRTRNADHDAVPLRLICPKGSKSRPPAYNQREIRRRKPLHIPDQNITHWALYRPLCIVCFFYPMCSSGFRSTARSFTMIRPYQACPPRWTRRNSATHCLSSSTGPYHCELRCPGRLGSSLTTDFYIAKRFTQVITQRKWVSSSHPRYRGNFPWRNSDAYTSYLDTLTISTPLLVLRLIRARSTLNTSSSGNAQASSSQ